MDPFLAKVSNIASLDEFENPATARVLPLTADGVVTAPFAVFWPLRAGKGQIKVDDVVICLQFADGSGLILSRPDGTWTQTIEGKVTAEDDFTAGGVSLKKHTHPGVHGETQKPTPTE